MTKTEWVCKFKSKLIDLMNRQHVSQRELARRSNLSVSRINDYINGRSIPSAYAVINISYALGINISELIDFDERIHK